LSGEMLSNSCRVGMRPSAICPSCQPEEAITQSPGLVTATRAASAAFTCARLLASCNATLKMSRAAASVCRWLSRSPGTTVAPLRSITLVAAFASADISESLPTARMRLPATATACAVVNAGSTVRMRPWRRMVSAGTIGAARPFRGRLASPAAAITVAIKRRRRCVNQLSWLPGILMAVLLVGAIARKTMHRAGRHHKVCRNGSGRTSKRTDDDAVLTLSAK